VHLQACSGKPCRNGGTCWSSANTFYCACRPGFTGKTCQGNQLTLFAATTIYKYVIIYSAVCVRVGDNVNLDGVGSFFYFMCVRSIPISIYLSRVCVRCNLQYSYSKTGYASVRAYIYLFALCADRIQRGGCTCQASQREMKYKCHCSNSPIYLFPGIRGVEQKCSGVNKLSLF
jgi:EGF-like domain